MLDLRYVTDNLEEVTAALSRRGFTDAEVLAGLAARATERRSIIADVEALRAKRNEVSKAMGAIADKKSDEFARQREAMREVGDRVKALETRQKTVESELDAVMLALPNLPDASTPDGLDESQNVEVRVWGDKPTYDFEPRDHHDLGVGLGIVDFERAVKISGARFSILRGAGARLERALIAFMLDLHVERHGYEEVWPPVLVRDSALLGTSQLPKFAADQFRIARDAGWEQHQEGASGELFLSPTAEVQLTNLHADEILDGDTLPRAYTAFTPCFRAEAGSYGKDTRGLIRQHQFDKVELVRVCRPDQGREQLEVLTGHAEEVLKRLGLHHRVVHLCAGDMGFAATKTYDLEVWLPGQAAYREISSCSWCGDFQARRAKIRFRPGGAGKKAKPQLAHTLNGSGVAVGRTLVAILEQNQQADGSVVIPEALRGYMGGLERITPTR
jgi:seryl-tRNA synthetase